MTDKSKAYLEGQASYYAEATNPYNQYEQFQQWSDWYAGYGSERGKVDSLAGYVKAINSNIPAENDDDSVEAR